MADINLFLSLIQSFNKACNIKSTKYYKNPIGLIAYDDIIIKKDVKSINKYTIDGLLTYDKITYNNTTMNKERNSSYKLYMHSIELSCSALDKYIISFQFIKNGQSVDDNQYKSLEKILSYGDS